VELFHDWSWNVCDEQPCICKTESKSILINTQIDSSYDDRCICSECSCTCEKYQDDKSICLCSQCSCKCLKDFSNENQDPIEDIREIEEKNSENQINIKEELKLISTEQIPIIEQNEIIISDCFINRIDRWTQQFDLFQSTEKKNSFFFFLKNIFNLLKRMIVHQ